MRDINLKAYQTIALLILMLVIACVGLNTNWRKGLDFRFPPQVRSLIGILDYSDSNEWVKETASLVCHMPEKYDGNYPLTCEDKRRPLIALWGDSHASYLTPGLINLQKSYPFGLLRFSNPRCPPVLKVDDFVFRKECIEMQSYILSELIKSQPDLIILHFAYREPVYFWTADYFASKFFDTIELLKLKVPKAKILVIGPVPRWSPSPQAITLRRWLFQSRSQGDLPVRQPASQLIEYDKVLESGAKKMDYIYISPDSLLCNQEGCIARVGSSYKDFIAVDYGHFSRSGSIYFVSLISKKILENLPLRN